MLTAFQLFLLCFCTLFLAPVAPAATLPPHHHHRHGAPCHHISIYDSCYFLNQHADGDEEELEEHEVKAAVALHATASLADSLQMEDDMPLTPDKKKSKGGKKKSTEDEDIEMSISEEESEEEYDDDDDDDDVDDEDDDVNAGPDVWNSDASSSEEEDKNYDSAAENADLMDSGDEQDVWVDERPKMDFIVAHKVLEKEEWVKLLSTKNTAAVKNGEFIHIVHPVMTEKEKQDKINQTKKEAEDAKPKKRGRKKADTNVKKVSAQESNIEERFLIKWKGYSFLHTSWETRETLLTLVYRAEILGKVTVHTVVVMVVW